MAENLRKAAKVLNLKSHVCGVQKTSTQKLYTATDLEGHIGGDGRLYIIDLSRTFPPEAPHPSAPRSYLFRLLRPEFVKTYQKRLCPDAISSFIKHDKDITEHNQEIYEATEYLLAHIIPVVSRLLSSKVFKCHKDGTLQSFQLSLCVWLHQQGINCRMMGLVRTRDLNKAEHQDAQDALLVEMCARVIKNKIRLLLRQTSKQFKIPVEEPYREVVTKLLNLVFTNGPKSLEFWNTEIKSGLLIQFASALTEQEMKQGSIFSIKHQVAHYVVREERKGVSVDGRYLILVRLQQMLGLQFRRQFMNYMQKWFNKNRQLNEVSDEPFQTENVKGIGQRVKHINIIDYAQGYIYKQRGQSYFREDNEASSKYFKKALQKFERALESNPHDKEILRNCAEITTALHGYADAQHQKIAAGPDDPWVQRVETYLKRALEVDQQDPETLFQYAQFLRYWRHEMDFAENYYLQALEIQPNYLNCIREYGNMLSSVRLDDEAAQSFYKRAKELKLKIEGDL
eukprot:CAMPEP_0168516550 /NCGR_PEP_ID=MMETSP0405-20121227/5473_1 /TAXON_ID=498012 /ORGANISM="Trichosphaerium sp, Strain Am-I-7 wt" /LENGTH=511 /DNA_ID=CAMNT_0008536291 /DNA_START=723 /DNA_END=2258 /DNA_ORIENTATION=+